MFVNEVPNTDMQVNKIVQITSVIGKLCVNIAIQWCFLKMVSG